MSLVYLSPSTQEFNPYITGGNEEQYMNQVADEIQPWFQASGISFVRNHREMTTAQVIEASNAGVYDLHLALHSNAAPDALSGTLRGADVYYDPRSTSGKRAAQLIAERLKTVYPLPEKVKAVPTESIGEVTKTRAPAVLVEIAYHDNREDALWIQNNTGPIAQAIAAGVCRYFSLPILAPQPPRQGKVDLSWGRLNIREQPTLQSAVLAQAYDGAALTIWNQYQSWYVVSFGQVFGYASSSYITLEV